MQRSSGHDRPGRSCEVRISRSVTVPAIIIAISMKKDVKRLRAARTGVIGDSPMVIAIPRLRENAGSLASAGTLTPLASGESDEPSNSASESGVIDLEMGVPIWTS